VYNRPAPGYDTTGAHAASACSNSVTNKPSGASLVSPCAPGSFIISKGFGLWGTAISPQYQQYPNRALTSQV